MNKINKRPMKISIAKYKEVSERFLKADADYWGCSIKNPRWSSVSQEFTAARTAADIVFGDNDTKCELVLRLIARIEEAEAPLPEPTKRQQSLWPIEDWRYEVGNEYTKRGYYDWVRAKVGEEEEGHTL